MDFLLVKFYKDFQLQGNDQVHLTLQMHWDKNKYI